MHTMIKRNFVNVNKTCVSKLYKQLFRPQLEQAVKTWNPCFIKDIELFECNTEQQNQYHTEEVKTIRIDLNIKDPNTCNPHPK